MHLASVSPSPVPRLSLASLGSEGGASATPPAATATRTQRHRRVIGFIPQLVSLEASGFLPPSTHAPSPPKPAAVSARSSLFNDIQFRLNTEWTIGCLWDKQPAVPRAPATLSAADDSPPSPHSPTGETPPNPKEELAESLRLVIEQIQELQLKKTQDIRNREKEAQRLAEEARKTAENERLRAASLEEKRKLERAQVIREAEAVSPDVRTALIIGRAIRALEECDGFRAFLTSGVDEVKRLRVEITKLTAAVPNQLAATSSRLVQSYNSVFEARRNLIESTMASVCSGILGNGFAETLERIAKVEPTILSPLMTLSLPSFHLYLKLSKILLESCQNQVGIQPSAVWMYAHFLGMLFKGWTQDFQLIFYGCLYNESPWLIPLPVADVQRRKEASSEELSRWCKQISSLFRLRLAILQSQKMPRETWTIVARFLNRVVPRLNHPLSVFLLEAVFDIASCDLSEISAKNFLKMAQLCQQQHLATLWAMCNDVDVWPELKVPVVKIEAHLKAIIKRRGMMMKKPDGYQMKQQAAELDADV